MIFGFYGTLKSSFPNHHVIKDCIYLGKYRTQPKYTMYSLGGFPAVIEGGETSIQMELYEVKDAKVIQNLYRLEGYRGIDNPDNLYNLSKIPAPFADDIYVFTFAKPERLKNYPTISDGIWKL